MDFTIDESSITFEYVYKAFTINIADYVTHLRPQPGYSDIQPEGKISVLIQKFGNDLSARSVERIAAHIQNRMIRGVATACDKVIEINVGPSDQFMYLLHNAIDVVLP